MNNNTAHFILLFVVFCAIVFGLYYVSIHFIETPLDFLYGVALSIIAAGVFYIFQVFVPEKRRKYIVKKNFRLSYISFKEECINIFLSALDISHDSDLTQSLLDVRIFREYFNENTAVDLTLTRWGYVINRLDVFADEELLNRLFFQFDVMSQEIDFVLSSNSLCNKDFFDFLKRFKITLYRLKFFYLNNNNDNDKKELLQFFWSLFAGWDWKKGYSDGDFVEEIIDAI